MYKLIRPDGTDFYSGTINYIENIGKIVRVEDYDPSPCCCGRGIHASRNPLTPFSMNAKIPCRVVEVKGIGLLGRDPKKSRYKAVNVIREITDLDTLFGFRYSEAVNPINPLLLSTPPVDDEIVRLVKEWSSVVDSVIDSVWDSVGDSVIDSVWSSVGASVGESVWSSVWSSVGDSVVDSVVDSVGDSVIDSVWAYIGSMFPGISKWKDIEHEQGVYPFESGNRLWRMGFVPSYDGKKWRLHAGMDAKIVWEE